jgi:hypothetical protein
LLDLVDGSSSSRLSVGLATLNWKLDFMEAAEVVFGLMCNNVFALDLSSLFIPDARCFGAVVANLSQAVPGAGAPILLPKLQHLTVRLSQVKLLSAIAAATPPGSLKQLSLWCCQACRLGQPAATDALGVEMVSVADVVEELERVGECACHERAGQNMSSVLLYWYLACSTLCAFVADQQRATGAGSRHACWCDRDVTRVLSWRAPLTHFKLVLTTATDAVVGGAIAPAGESLAASVETLAFPGGHHCLDKDPDESYYPVASFAQRLTNLKSLAIPDCAYEYTDSFQEGLASCIAPLHCLTLLHISGTREGIDMAGGGMCVDLRHLTSLQDLSFNTTNACTITTAGLKLLPGCSNIKALQLTGDLSEFDVDIAVGGYGFGMLGHLPACRLVCLRVEQPLFAATTY